MVEVTIGNSANKIHISDNATVGNGVYRWYIPGSWNSNWPMKPTYKQTVPAGKSMLRKGYSLDESYSFSDIPIDSFTDYQNLLKALHYWEKNSSKLYLWIQTDGFGANNLAVLGTYAAPDTITTQFTGKLINFKKKGGAANLTVSVEMPFSNTGG